MSKNLRIGLAGATGALGKEVLTVLDAAPWRPDRVVPLAGASTTTPFVSYGDEQVTVDELGREDFAGLDALIVALPRAIAGEWVEAAAAAGVPVIDLSGSQLEALDVPLVLPWLQDGALDEERARDVVAVPSAAAAMLVTLVRALAEELDGHVEATVFVPASSQGKAAIEELSRQVVALFNGQNPPRKVFPQGLAFDLLPQIGEPTSTGWTGEELRCVAEVARMTGERVDVTMVGVPVFSGMSVHLRVDVDETVPDERFLHLLEAAGLEVVPAMDARRTPRPRRVEGSSGVAVGRVRRAQGGRVLHLWASMDNLRATASAAVGIAAALVHAREEA